MQIDLYTIGYEGRTIDSFIEQLKISEISRIIDVRDIPVSRKKGFSSVPLKETLESNGIKYIHIKSLGSPATFRKKLKEDGDYDYFFKAYSEYLSENIEIIKDVYRFILDGVNCIMCFERLFNQCHRSIITDKIKEISNILFNSYEAENYIKPDFKIKVMHIQ